MQPPPHLKTQSFEGGEFKHKIQSIILFLIVGNFDVAKGGALISLFGATEPSYSYIKLLTHAKRESNDIKTRGRVGGSKGG